MKRGIFGGTFDPVHNGHLRLAETALKQLGLNELVFMPAGEPWFKASQNITAARHRVAMLRLAVRELPQASVATMEVDRPGPTYTVDTLRELCGQGNEADEISLLMSYSTLAELPRWKAPREIIRRCRLAVVPRPGTPRPDLDAMEASLPGISHRVDWVDMPEIDVSATRVRESVACGETIDDLVPPAVARYIAGNGLYTV